MKKLLKVFLVLLLVALVPLGLVACDKGNNDGTDTGETGGTPYTRDGSTLFFGSYPQLLVTDSAITNTLTTAAYTLPSESDSANWTSYGYYIADQVQNFMWYIDIEQDGEKYRGVYFTSYRPESTKSLSTSNKQDDNGYTTGNVYWFKWEPISWTILTENYNSTGGALILCDMIIDSQEVSSHMETRKIEEETIYPNNYEYSTIRSWLNDTFYNMAFNNLQKELIMSVTLDNSVESTGHENNKYACADTTDNVFLLSRNEVEGTYDRLNSDAKREKKPTDYALSQGCLTCDADDPLWAGNGYWWLRSPYWYEYRKMHQIRYDGNIPAGVNVHRTSIGVVPALVIDLT